MGMLVVKLILVVLKAHFDAMIMAPKMLRKKNIIWKNARITKAEFSKLSKKFEMHKEDVQREIDVLDKYG